MRNYVRDDKAALAACPRKRLTMIAMRRGDQVPAIALSELTVAEHSPAAHFEGAGRKMIFVLDPKIAAGAPRRQRPLDSQGNQRMAVDRIRSIVKVSQGKHRPAYFRRRGRINQLFRHHPRRGR